ncbi:hypothetical protein RJ640_003321 [Escallonia rubra]|uniref:Uncharacterized protein n=1 Tax=Escallonia rubra TaxID=112253 RepID=A0AA88QJK2_9ASTE|nr:hypothetical protein RJ640_003321 [Escallonia rubra]
MDVGKEEEIQRETNENCNSTPVFTTRELKDLRSLTMYELKGSLQAQTKNEQVRRRCSYLLTGLLRDQGPEVFDVDDGVMELVAEAVEVAHADLAEVAQMVLVEEDAVMIDNVEVAKCACCGLMEECTAGYVRRVREEYKGRWICGMCGEPVKEEVAAIGIGEVLDRHRSFRDGFRSSGPPPNAAEDLIRALKQILLRGLDSPRSAGASPTKKRVAVRVGELLVSCSSRSAKREKQ